jgi:RHS repeat-associated protein
MGYTLDNIGNRRSSEAGGDAAGGNSRSAAYQVNALNEITSRSVPGAFDVMGLALGTSSVTVNSQTPYRKGEYFRKEISVSNGSNPAWQSVTVAASGETSVTGNAYVPKSPEQFAYDADGDLTGDGRWTYVWDAENRLVQMVPTTAVTVPDGAKRKLDFVYDYKGRRIQKSVSIWNGTDWTLTVSNRFLYDAWNMVAELNATNNAVIRTYLWGLDLSGSLQGAGGVGGLLAISDASKGRHFVSYDGNGNVMQTVASADGNISAVYEYGPFGEVLRASGPMAKANPFRFSTKYQDDETDLLYYGYRYYNASTGRWTSCDPFEEVGGDLLLQLTRKQQIAGLARGAIVRQVLNGQRAGDLNLYAFVLNRPLAWFDTDGRIPIEGPGPSIPPSLPDPPEPPTTHDPPLPPPKPGDTWRICCQPVEGYEFFQHCDLR